MLEYKRFYLFGIFRGIGDDLLVRVWIKVGGYFLSNVYESVVGVI